MEQDKIWEPLNLFDEAVGDENTQPAPIPQAEAAITAATADEATTGDNEGNATDAGERNETERAEFLALMEGTYKPHFTAYFQEAFNRRFKEHKEMEKELKRIRGTLTAVTEFFGTDEAGLAKALESERQKRAVLPSHPESEAQREAERAQEVRQAVEAAVAASRLETESLLLAHIRARGLRPAESALSDTARDALRGGASRLSRAERAELARRAANGERIKL